MDKISSALKCPGTHSVETYLVCICDTHRNKILGSLEVGVVMLGIAFFTIALHASSICYVDPCYEGRGMDIMSKVDIGLSIEVVAAGVVYILHPLAGLFFLYRKCVETTAGIYIGLGMLICCNAIIDSIVWGTKANMMSEMSGVYYQGSVAMSVNSLAEPLFTSLSTFAGLIFVLKITASAMLLYSTEPLVGPSGVDGSGGGYGNVSKDAVPGSSTADAAYTGVIGSRYQTETESLMRSEESNAVDDNPFQA